MDDEHAIIQKKLKEARKESRKDKSDSRLRKEAKQKEHVRKTLKRQQEQQGRQRSSHHGSQSSRPPPPPPHAKRHKSSSGPPPSSRKPDVEGGSSEFQSLFSKRATGFMVELSFRNAPPRPPVGPCFVGLGLDGELTRWTKYRPGNAVEKNYTWKLHCPPDLGVPLAPSAMDLRCYRNPGGARKLPSGYVRLVEDDLGNNDGDNDDYGENNDGEGGRLSLPLHPDDAALLDWKGSMGDTAAEQAAGGAAAGIKTTPAKSKAGGNGGVGANRTGNGTANTSSNKKSSTGRLIRDNKNVSRVLKDHQPWMLQTTYLSNDFASKVHNHTTAVTIKKRAAEEVDQQMKDTRAKTTDPETIEAGFRRWSSSSDGNNSSKNDNRPVHPTAGRRVHPVCELPLLPSVDTWGHSYVHVVLDKPPPGADANALSRAVVADVETNQQNQQKSGGMACRLWIPTTTKKEKPNDKDHTAATRSPSTVLASTHTYDLEAVPLKNDEHPPTYFLLIVDEDRGAVYYQAVTSRVQLSNGRPHFRTEKGTDATANRTEIVRRPMSEADIKDVEMRMAEVDQDLENKFKIGGFDDDDDDDEEEEEGENENEEEDDDNNNIKNEEDSDQQPVKEDDMSSDGDDDNF